MPRLPLIQTPTDWFADAACRGADTDVFFPSSDAAAAEAKAICAACPVREDCLEHALEMRPSDGVWGGLTAIERHRMIRRRQKAARRARGAAA
ncbi:MAG TPA: WhiB family transcriptional regulator [Acidimicrobiia bacterium]|nr:WhiB family transcriptional regulator [Acidimicrobiia bacterium]